MIQKGHFDSLLSPSDNLASCQSSGGRESALVLVSGDGGGGHQDKG